MPIAESIARLRFARLATPFRLILFLALAPTLCGWAQAGSTTNRPMLPQPIGQGANNDADVPSESQERDEKLLRALNADRQKALISDTNKLLRLVNELNAEIAGKHPDSLSPDQVHKMAEIEKLAHSVKDKMTTSVRGIPAFQAPFQPVHN